MPEQEVSDRERLERALLDRVAGGEHAVFGELVEPYRRELQLHCYRILGSLEDAEDLVQETLTAAWRSLREFQARSSVRTWLYRIATNRCLNAVRDRDRRPRRAEHQPRAALPAPSRWAEPAWHQPYPDVLLDAFEPLDPGPGPAARIEQREGISLAFVTAMQALPPRQRAVLVLRDVLGFRAAEAAEMLGTTEAGVASALSRARTTMSTRPGRGRPPLPGSAREQRVVGAFVAAFEAGDVSSVVDLLTDDAWVTMPPLPLEYQGRAAADGLFEVVFERGRRCFRLVPTRANGQPAFGCYLRDPRTGVAHAHGLLVLTLDEDRISHLTRFVDNGLMSRFGLPRSLPG
jgi:RNA polymerase sigma-70 factor (ECF subfamily)